MGAASSKAAGLVVAGYSLAGVALVAFLTINGASGIPTAATIGTAVLIAMGLLMPAAGMILLRRRLGAIEGAARLGYEAQAIGLIGLLFGVVLIVTGSSLQGDLVGALFIAVAGVFATAGVLLLRRHYLSITENSGDVAFLILGTLVVFSGVGLIVGSNVAFWYLISQVQNTVYVDIGATITACGCVLEAYSFHVLLNRG